MLRKSAVKRAGEKNSKSREDFKMKQMVSVYFHSETICQVLDGRGASHLSPSPVRTHRARLRQWAQDKIIHVPVEKAIANGRPVRRGADATVQTVQTVPN